MKTFVNKTFDVGPLRFGVSHDLVTLPGGVPYLERWILWLGFTIRIHKFWRGDDNRAPHSHPWAFLTVPLNRGYDEQVYGPWIGNSRTVETRYVSKWRPHFRRADHKHIVILPASVLPVWTFVISGFRTNSWGFYP